jgi:hypothetical protein
MLLLEEIERLFADRFLDFELSEVSQTMQIMITAQNGIAPFPQYTNACVEQGRTGLGDMYHSTPAPCYV